MKSSATTAVILEKRKPLKNGHYPVKLRITYQRERHYYTLRDGTGKGFSFTEQEFKKIKCERPREPYKEISLYLNELEKHARDLIETLPVFLFELFEKKYFSDTDDNEDVFSALKNTASELKNEGRISTSSGFQCSLQSLKKFTGKKGGFFIPDAIKRVGFFIWSPWNGSKKMSFSKSSPFLRIKKISS